MYLLNTTTTTSITTNYKILNKNTKIKYKTSWLIK